MGRRDPPDSYGVGGGCESAQGASVAESGDPAWRSPYGIDFVHVLVVADVGVSLRGRGICSLSVCFTCEDWVGLSVGVGGRVLGCVHIVCV